MSTDPRIEAAARALNTGGWTCQEGSDEPGNYDNCADCKRYCDEHATAALAAADAASVVTTVEELDALPAGSVIRSELYGVVRDRLYGGWLAIAADNGTCEQSKQIAGREHRVLHWGKP